MYRHLIYENSVTETLLVSSVNGAGAFKYPYEKKEKRFHNIHKRTIAGRW